MNQLAIIFVRAFMMLCQLYTSLIIITALLSWLVSPMSKVMQVLHSMTEPVVAPFRKLTQKLIPATGIPIDLSPLLAYLALQILISILSRVLWSLL